MDRLCRSSNLATKSGAKDTRLGWRGNASSQDIDCPDWPAIVAGIGCFLRRDHCSFKRRSGEETLAPAVGVDCRSRCHPHVRIAAYRSRGRARVGAERDIPVTGERAHCSVRVEHKNEVGDFRANLGAPPGTASSDEGRTRPASACPSNHHALPPFAAYAKTHFDHRDNGESLGVAQDTRGDAFLWHPPKVSQNGGGLINYLLLGRGPRGREREGARKEKNAEFFHGYS
jgi:hypothetical protein